MTKIPLEFVGGTLGIFCPRESVTVTGKFGTDFPLLQVTVTLTESAYPVVSITLQAKSANNFAFRWVNKKVI